jgi:hypothetical protein
VSGARLPGPLAARVSRGLPDPPEGFEWRGASGLFICSRPDATTMILASLGAVGGALPPDVARLLGTEGGSVESLPDAAARARPAGGGRGAVARIAFEDGTSAILKRYRRGGIARRFLPSLFVRWDRPLAEIQVAEAARRAGAPVAEPLAALFTDGRLLHAAFLVTRELPDRVALSAALRRAGEGDAQRLLAEAASAARMCHDAGLVHGDLNLGNLLVAPPAGAGGRKGPRQGAVVIDLDRASFRPEGASVSERFANLSRLARSHEKIFGTRGPWGPDPARRIVEAYAAGDAILRATMIALLPAHRRAMRLHRFGWKLTGSGSRKRGRTPIP